VELFKITALKQFFFKKILEKGTLRITESSGSFCFLQKSLEITLFVSEPQVLKERTGSLNLTKPWFWVALQFNSKKSF